MTPDLREETLGKGQRLQDWTLPWLWFFKIFSYEISLYVYKYFLK